MPERASVTQSVQVGVESTPGTAVPAGKLFSSIGIEPAIQIDINRFRPMGQKYPSILTPGREWVQAGLSGVGSYSELVYLLSGIMNAPTPSTVDTSAKQWLFESAARAEDSIKTLTVEQGGAVRAHSFAYGLPTELTLNMTRNGVEVGGAMIGQRLSDAITMTPTPTGIEEKPILGRHVDVFIDSASGGLGTTKLTRAFNAVWRLGNRFNPVWALNTLLPSFASHVETEPTAQIELLVAADAQGMGELTTMRAGTTRFIRILATGDDLAGAATQKYEMRIDAAAKVSGISEFTDEDGVYAVRYTFDVVYDATWTHAQQVRMTNKLGSL